jgi:oleandomycin transport system permease protein
VAPGFVEINPVTHVADAARGLLTGGPVAMPVTFALISSAVVMAVFAPLAVYLYRRRT